MARQQSVYFVFYLLTPKSCITKIPYNFFNMVPETRKTCEQLLHNLKMYKLHVDPFTAIMLECVVTLIVPPYSTLSDSKLWEIYFTWKSIFYYIRGLHTIYHTIEEKRGTY